MSHPPRFYAAPNFVNMGIKIPSVVVLWTTSTMKDEKSAAKFHYIKTVSGKVVEQSVAFRVVSTCWQGDDPVTLKSCLQVTCPLMSMGDVRTHNSRTDNHRIFKLGGGVDHVTRHVRPLTKVKRSKVKVTRSQRISSNKAISRQRMVLPTSNLVETVTARCASRDTLSRSVGQQ